MVCGPNIAPRNCHICEHAPGVRAGIPVAVHVTPTLRQCAAATFARVSSPSRPSFPAPSAGIALAHFVVAGDVERSLRFYRDVLGGEVVRDGAPAAVALANSWIIINSGGGPTDDKPTVLLEPPAETDRVSSFLNIRVADIRAVYSEWSARGGEFLTEPKDHGREIRCYLRDPDGHLIEVGQATGMLTPPYAFT